MQLLSKQLEGQVRNSSMIRKMFEQGIELRKKFGADAVCDFSLGNPDLTPPPAIIEEMKELCETVARPAGRLCACFGVNASASRPRRC